MLSTFDATVPFTSCCHWVSKLNHMIHEWRAGFNYAVVYLKNQSDTVHKILRSCFKKLSKIYIVYSCFCSFLLETVIRTPW